MEARASRSLRTVTAEMENRFTMSATVTWPSWSTRSSTLLRRCSVSRRALGVMHRFRNPSIGCQHAVRQTNERIEPVNTFVFFRYPFYFLFVVAFAFLLWYRSRNQFAWGVPDLG